MGFLLFIFILSFTLALSLVLASSPLFLGLWVLILALRVSLLLGLTTISWLGLFIFLIYVGALLVIFAYFVALAPNQIIEAKIIFILSVATYFSLIFILYPNFIVLASDFSYLSQSPIIALFSLSNILIFLFLALVLFFALVAVVKIRTIVSGPLRPFS